jgi:hypothetical protein
MDGHGLQVRLAEKRCRQAAARVLVEGYLAGDGATRRIEIDIDRKLAVRSVGPSKDDVEISCASIEGDQPFTVNAPH